MMDDKGGDEREERNWSEDNLNGQLFSSKMKTRDRREIEDEIKEQTR